MSQTQYSDEALNNYSKWNDKIWMKQVHPNPVVNSDFEHALYGLISEVGELADIAKKLKFVGRTDRNTSNVIDEAGDVLFYLDRILRSVGSSINEAMILNVVKLQTRYGTEAEKIYKGLKPDKDAEKQAQLNLMVK